MNIAQLLRTAFFIEYLLFIIIFQKFYAMMDIKYLKVKFYYCKIRPQFKQKELHDRLIKLSCEDMVFSQLRFQFKHSRILFCYLIISLLQRFVKS